MTKISRPRAMLWAFALALTVPFAPALAGEAGFMPWTDILMMADTDSDGGVSMMEVESFREPAYAGFQPWMGKNFNAIDLNQDGMVTMYEMKKYTMEHGMDERDLPMLWYKK